MRLCIAATVLLGLAVGCQQGAPGVPVPDPVGPDPTRPEEPAPKPPAGHCAAWTSSTSDELVFDGMQVIQVIEVGNGIPLITGRPVLVRAQLRHASGAGKPLDAPVEVLVHVANSAGLAETVPAEGPGCVPETVDLDDLGSTYNAVVPADWLVGAVSVHVSVALAEGAGAAEAGPRWPPEGAVSLDVVEPPPFHITFVPITYGDIHADVDGVEADAYMSWTYPRFPLDQVDAVFREPLVTTSIEGETWGAASSRILGELRQLRADDGSDRYYFGLLPLAAFSPGGGMAFMGEPVGIGRDVSLGGGRGGIVAHELGHNFGLQHVPLCDGSLDGADPDYPHEKGQSGVYGYDWDAEQLMLPTSGDVMSYCPPWWISDYHYMKVLDFRADEARGD